MEDSSEGMKSDGPTKIMCNKSGLVIKATNKQVYTKLSS